MWVKRFIAICVYAGLFNVYIWLITISTHYAHLLYDLLTISALLFYYFNNNTQNELNKGLNRILFFSVIGNFSVIFLYWTGILPGKKEMFYLFNGLIFANTIIIFTCMKRHGIAND